MAASETAACNRASGCGVTNDTAPQQQARAKKRKRFPHGNYTGYYGTRYGNDPTPATGSSANTYPAAAAAPDLVGARDPRLKLLRRSWFEGKKCLDIGCNEGHLTIAIVRSFRPRRMIGIDIDNYLVHLAKRALAAEISTSAATGEKPAFRPLMPRSLRGGKVEGVTNGTAEHPRHENRKTVGDNIRGRCNKAGVPANGAERKRKEVALETEDDAKASKLVGEDAVRNGPTAGSANKRGGTTGATGPVANQHTEVKGSTPVDTPAAAAATATAAAAGVVADATDVKVLSGCTVSFQREDFVAEAHGGRGYDVICLFSVVKWMHINGGDEAVRDVFRKAYNLLSPGGRLILEPQPWKSYKKSARQHGSAEARDIVDKIKLRPPDFPALLTEEVGFRSWDEVGLPSEGVGGFAKRSVHVFLK
eukprot:g6029.t1